MSRRTRELSVLILDRSITVFRTEAWLDRTGSGYWTLVDLLK